MRILFVIVLLLCPLSAQAGWLATRKIDRLTLNVLIRRLERMSEQTEDAEIRESCEKCLYHLDAYATRRGRIHVDDEIALDTKDEQRLIMQAMGLAATVEARTGFWTARWNATKRWAWKKVKGAIYHSLPWGVIATYLWCSRRRLGRALWQYDRRVETLPDDVRHSFRGADLERAHARFKKKGFS